MLVDPVAEECSPDHGNAPGRWSLEAHNGGRSKSSNAVSKQHSSKQRISVFGCIFRNIFIYVRKHDRWSYNK